jgi:lipopolysaccharide export system protein LptC
MNKWHFLTALGLSLILIIIVWQAPSSGLLELTDKTYEEQKQLPDSYLVSTKTTQYNPQGQVSHILIADKISYFEPTNTQPERYTVFVAPQFTFFNETSPNIPWEISSNTARSLNNDEELLLTGNVILIQQSANSDAPTTITSEQLLIKPNEQYAETDKPVIIKDKSGTTSSTGLKLSLDKATIELLSKVRSRYEPR